jgi:hypothetical protein
MIRTWPGQTKEEWEAEYRRDKALTPAERESEVNEYVKSVNEKWNNVNAEKNAEQQRSTQDDPFKNCDHPNSLEDTEATIVWVVVMVVGAIFKDSWLIWIVATIIWRKYITRHKIKK